MINKRTEGKVLSHYGMMDYFKYYKENGGSLIDGKKFGRIVDDFNTGVVDLILNEGLEYNPPTLQFIFCIRKSKRGSRMKDNKVINSSPVDWKTTNKLWEEDKEAKEKKIVIRFLNNHSSKFVFRIKALHTGKTYSNRKLYRFKPVRSFQRNLKDRIFDSKKDDFECYDLY